MSSRDRGSTSPEQLTGRPENESAARAQSAFLEAVALHQAGRFKDAVIAYGRAVELKPDFVGALCNLGIALKQSGRINEAIDAYRRALEIAPHLADVHFNLGIVLARVQRYPQAIESYRRAIEIKPELAPAYANLGNALKKSERLDEAIEAYRQAIAIMPNHLGALTNLGIALNELGRHGEAIDTCHQALEIKVDCVPALSQLSMAHAAQGRHEDAAATAGRALQIEPSNAEALASLATALKALDRVEELVEAYREAIAKDPQAADAYMALAELRLEQNDPQGALAACDECLEQSLGNVWALAMKTTVLNELRDLKQLDYLVDFDQLIFRKRWDKVLGFADLDQFNSALSDHILNHPTLVYQPSSQATRLGRHSGNLLVDPLGPISALEKMICTAIDDYAQGVQPDPAHPFVAKVPAQWRLSVWSVVLETQGYQVPHIHPSAWLSGVYYVKVPGVVAANEVDQAGWIEFGRPFLRHNVRAEPKVRAVRPEEGLMLLFPSYFLHRTLPFDSEDMRISIAFDVVPLDPDEVAGRG